jgi:F-type H+-transporting ATPase subunit a
MKELHISVAPETIANIGNFNVTNSLLTSLVVMLLLIAIALHVRKDTGSTKKSNFAILMEMFIEGFYNFFKNIVGERSERLFPLLITFFLFIIIANWIGLVPGIGSIGIYAQTEHGREFIPLFRGPNADLNTTLALALISVGITQYMGISALGFKNYIGKFINIKDPIKLFTGLLESISEFAKIISFSFRLFGNIFAGEVLIAVMTFIVPVYLKFIVPVPFFALEVFVGFIQALVFTMLTAIFIVVATEEHHA